MPPFHEHVWLRVCPTLAAAARLTLRAAHFTVGDVAGKWFVADRTMRHNYGFLFFTVRAFCPVAFVSTTCSSHALCQLHTVIRHLAGVHAV